MSDDNGMDADNVTIPREQYEWFLRMTTPQPIGAADTQRNLMINSDTGWSESYFDIDELAWTSLNGDILINPTHWKPLPEFKS